MKLTSEAMVDADSEALWCLLTQRHLLLISMRLCHDQEALGAADQMRLVLADSRATCTSAAAHEKRTKTRA